VLKVGVVGVGSMGQNHARLYSEMADLVGVYDVSGETSQSVARRLGTTAYHDLSEMLSEVEAVSICAPTAFHQVLAEKAMEAGVHFLLEKPFIGFSSAAEELCLKAEERGLAVAAGFVERFNPVVGAAREAVAEDRFGEVISMASRRVSSFPSRIRDVGVIMDLAIHDVDVMRHITASEVKSVYAIGGRFSHPEFEDYIELLMEMESGIVCFLEANWLTPMKVRRVSLTCSRGFVELDYIDQSLEFCSTQFRELDPGDMFNVPLEQDLRRISVRKEEPLKRELESFSKAVNTGTRPDVDGWQAVADLRVCEAAKRSLERGEKVSVRSSTF
jgi:UDP-N-acetylglucosamine 3-dehydrogenase